MGKQSVSTGVIVAVLVIVVVAIAAVGYMVFGSRGAPTDVKDRPDVAQMRDRARELANQAQQGKLKGPPPPSAMPGAH